SIFMLHWIMTPSGARKPPLACHHPATRDWGMSKSTIGDSPKRREDQRFVTGQGAYLDDLKFEALTHAVFVRSPHAHARVRSVEADAARKAPGVLAVLTATEAGADGLKPLRPYTEA